MCDICQIQTTTSAKINKLNTLSVLDSGGGGGGGVPPAEVVSALKKQQKKNNFFAHYMILRVYTVVLNWENTCDLDYPQFCWKKEGRGGTDRAVSVTRASKWWDFKSPVVWSRRIKHFCAPVLNKTWKKFGWVGEALIPRLKAVGLEFVLLFIFRSVVAAIANPM